MYVYANHCPSHYRQFSTITSQCDMSNERAHYSAHIATDGILMNSSLKKWQIQYPFFHCYLLNMDVLLNNELPVMKLYGGKHVSDFLFMA